GRFSFPLGDALAAVDFRLGSRAANPAALRFMKLCLFVVIFSIVSATFISGTFLRVLASFVIG
ncbi:unnamed protein product, partial [Prunus brigantina]